MPLTDILRLLDVMRWYPTFGARATIFLASYALMSVAVGCGDAGTFALGNAREDGRYREAQRHLAQHDIDEAREAYRQALETRREEGQNAGLAAAGVAVTESLLVLDREPVDRLLVNHLGAEEPLDVNRAIYADNGFLYWQSRGTSWVGEGDSPGIKDLIASRLPWTEQELSSLGSFTDGLTAPTGEMREELGSLANSLIDIENHIDTALEDPEFEGIYIPGEVFHDSDLSTTLRKSELAALGAAVASARAAIHAFRAYEHPWSLEDAFGPQFEEEAANNPPEREGWTAWDYSLDYLATRLAVIEASADARLQMRTALEDALSWAERSIELGLQEAGRSSSFAWDRVNTDYVRTLADLLAAVRRGLGETADIPTSMPQTTMMYDAFFAEGRRLPEGARWWTPNPVRADESDPESEVLYIEWLWSEPALQQVFFDGFFEPQIDITSDTTLDTRIGALERFPAFWDNLLSDQISSSGTY